VHLPTRRGQGGCKPYRTYTHGRLGYAPTGPHGPANRENAGRAIYHQCAQHLSVGAQPKGRASPPPPPKGTTRWRGDRRSGTHSITATLAGHYRGGLHYPFVRGFPRAHNFGSFEIYTVPKFPQRTGNRDLVFAPRHLLIAPFVLRLVVKNY